MSQPHIPRKSSGFSLIAVSILLTVAAILFVSFLPGQGAGDLNQKTINNVKKLEKVEEAMRSFMAFNGRRPCPADGASAIGTSTFGAEVGAPGECENAPLGPDASTGYVIGGTIPTRALGLPDDYAFDEWGRRFTYVVDKRATGNLTCTSLQHYPTNNGTGAITITSSMTSGTTLANTMYAYISHGPSGFGAFPAQGSTVGGRINSGSTDTDEQTNAGVGSSFNYTSTNFNTKVQKSRVAPTSGDTGFDNLVWFRPDIENTCCLGNKCINTSPGFRINGMSPATGIGAGYTMTHGDINCDGLQDLVIGAPGANGGKGYVYVVFGSNNGYSNPLSLNSTGLNGTTGITLSCSNCTDFGESLAVGDIDNDGCADIAIGGNNTAGGGDIYLLYGRSALQSSTAAYVVDTLATSNNCYAADFHTAAASNPPTGTLAIGDVNGASATTNDLIMSSYVGNIVWVMFGLANTCTATGHGQVTTPSVIPPTYANGFDVTTLKHSTTPAGLRINGPATNSGTFGGALAIGDINHDGINDIIIGEQNYSLGCCSYGGRVYAVFGQSNASGQPWNTADALNADGLLINGANTVSSGTIAAPIGFRANGSNAGNLVGGGLATGDINGDGIADIAVATGYYPYGGVTAVYTIYGRSTAGWQSIQTTYGAPFTFNNLHSAGALNWLVGLPSTGGGSVALGDINHDGKLDLIVGDNGNGAVYVLFGPVNADVYSWTMNGTNGVEVECPSSANGTCGFRLDAFDMNNDGITDLIIGSGAANVTGSNEEGWLYVLYGKSSGWTSTYSLSTIY